MRSFDLAGGQWPQALPVVVTALAAWAVLVRLVCCTGYMPAQHLSQHTSTAHKANDGINLPVHKNAMKVIGIIKYKKEKWEEAMLLGKGIWITATLCKVISSKNNKLVEVFLFLFELSKSIILNLNVLTLFVG